MSIRLGAIADDFTGATDLASMLSRGGLRTVLRLGVPDEGEALPETDAVVVALKSRTAPVDEAVADSVLSWRWLAEAGTERCYFKYCSTFDSTPEGNIGPVAEALMRETGATHTIYTPAFPENGRSIYFGKLFVGDVLLSESGMRNHPLTPMRDADLPRLLAPQLSEGVEVGLVPWPVVQQGAAAVSAALAALAAQGKAHVVVDALTQADLDALATAVRDAPLVTAGSGLGLSLAAELAGATAEPSVTLPAIGGAVLMLSGSCSEASNAQVNRWEADGGATLRLDPRALNADWAGEGERITRWFAARLALGQPCLIAATQPPEIVRTTQEELGTERAAALVEQALAAMAFTGRKIGARRFVVAGGETSGAVAQALGAERLAVGPSIAPGVPWCTTLEDAPVALALKSGNFGAESFFQDALEMAP